MVLADTQARKIGWWVQGDKDIVIVVMTEETKEVDELATGAMPVVAIPTEKNGGLGGNGSGGEAKRSGERQ